MSSRITSTSILLRALLPLAAMTLPASALELELRSGERLIGRVLSADRQGVEVSVGFPKQETRRIRADDLKPRSHYQALCTVADRDDAKAWKDLADDALELDLPGHAIAAWREAARLDSSMKKEAKEEIESIRERVGEKLVEQARRRLEEGRPVSAMMLAERAKRRFSGKDGNDAISDLLEEIDERMAGKQASRFLDADRVRDEMEDALKRLKRAKEEVPNPRASIASGDKNELEAAVEHLQPVAERLGKIAGAEDDPATTERLKEVRERVNGQYVDYLLALSRAYVRRTALENAEDVLERVYEVDPDNQEAMQLHDMILQARLCDQFPITIGGRRLIGR